ncbi:hypothetical protein FSP39_025086 [Pinctada imbricata]|uniref:SAP domain-containing protein n=1 Tax=Pinctada imbricata TaxID=66713 RepID=A0AA88YBZ1_PINIB|nr:hypothetical protein FSP39_025086 [Pinctada imbricata]
MNSAYEEFASFTVGNMKDYLSARGCSTQGNKQQLVARCYVAWKNKVELREVETDRLKRLNEEYQKRIEEVGIPDPRSLQGEVCLHAVQPNAVFFKVLPDAGSSSEKNLPQPLPVLAKEYTARGEAEKFLPMLNNGFTKEQTRSIEQRTRDQSTNID